MNTLGLRKWSETTDSRLLRHAQGVVGHILLPNTHLRPRSTIGHCRMAVSYPTSSHSNPSVLTSASSKSSCQKRICPALFLMRQTHQTTNQTAPLCGLDIHLAKSFTMAAADLSSAQQSVLTELYHTHTVLCVYVERWKLTSHGHLTSGTLHCRTTMADRGSAPLLVTGSRGTVD